MDKKELLMEYTTQDIIEYIVQDFGVEYDEAMRKLYTSEVFEKLQNPETGLYLKRPEYGYLLFQEESNFGYRVNSEI